MSVLGIAGIDSKGMNRKAVVGIAGVNSRPNQAAVLGIAGVDRVTKGKLAIAGNPGTPLRPLFRSFGEAPVVRAKTLGDRVQQTAWSRAVYLSDWTYLVCTNPGGLGLRWRLGFEEMFAPENRALPVGFDSAAFRISTGSAPRWADLMNYCQAIDLVRPDFWMNMDVIGSQEASLLNYERMVALGYGGGLIPVWQIGPTYDRSLSPYENGRRAAHDPIMRHYMARHKMIAIGGMVKGPCPRDGRHWFFKGLCDEDQDHDWWGLGQASHVVINGLGQLGLLDRVSTDGSWWIHHARTESIAVQQGGLLKSIKLAYTGMQSFFTMGEMMLCNLRSALGGYAGAWTFPAMPEEVAVIEHPQAPRAEKEAAGDAIRQRLAPEQATLWNILGGNADKTGTEG